MTRPASRPAIALAGRRSARGLAGSGTAVARAWLAVSWPVSPLPGAACRLVLPGALPASLSVLARVLVPGAATRVACAPGLGLLARVGPLASLLATSDSRVASRHEGKWRADGVARAGPRAAATLVLPCRAWRRDALACATPRAGVSPGGNTACPAPALWRAHDLACVISCLGERHIIMGCAMSCGITSILRIGLVHGARERRCAFGPRERRLRGLSCPLKALHHGQELLDAIFHIGLHLI